MGRPRKVEAEPVLAPPDDLLTAETCLRNLVAVKDMELRASANDYDAVRRVRQQGQKAWDDARAFLARPRVA